jgi:cellulose/xylan binding protein with CBM9 domain
MKRTILTVLMVFVFASSLAFAELKPGVRGVITRAPDSMKIDGDLAEFKSAFCTPVGYFFADTPNRAAQFFYMWDDEAFYCGLRTWDQKQANNAADNRLWEGDGVEWYFDTRRGEKLRAKEWGPGAVHMYWTAYKNATVQPRWCLRPDMLQAIPGTDVEVAARQTGYGAETEFKLPWSNFPDFKPAIGEVIALDAELCYSDGKQRVERTFAYGSPLSVTQPASQAKVQLVDRLTLEDWRQCGPVMFPVRCDTAWTQDTKAAVTGHMAIPANLRDQVSKVVFRLLDTQGEQVAGYEGVVQTLQPDGGFYRAAAEWPTDLVAPGQHFLMGIVYDREAKERARVAPRMVSDHMQPGH